MQKPNYGTSKKALGVSLVLAWAIMISLTTAAMLGSEMAVPMAEIMVPYMVGLVGLMLGIHRGFGSLDMWSMLRRQPSPES